MITSNEEKNEKNEFCLRKKKVNENQPFFKNFLLKVFTLYFFGKKTFILANLCDAMEIFILKCRTELNRPRSIENLLAASKKLIPCQISLHRRSESSADKPFNIVPNQILNFFSKFDLFFKHRFFSNGNAHINVR